MLKNLYGALLAVIYSAKIVFKCLWKVQTKTFVPPAVKRPLGRKPIKSLCKKVHKSLAENWQNKDTRTSNQFFYCNKMYRGDLTVENYSGQKWKYKKVVWIILYGWVAMIIMYRSRRQFFGYIFQFLFSVFVFHFINFLMVFHFSMLSLSVFSED